MRVMGERRAWGTTVSQGIRAGKESGICQDFGQKIGGQRITTRPILEESHKKRSPQEKGENFDKKKIRRVIFWGGQVHAQPLDQRCRSIQRKVSRKDTPPKKKSTVLTLTNRATDP